VKIKQTKKHSNESAKEGISYESGMFKHQLNFLKFETQSEAETKIILVYLILTLLRYFKYTFDHISISLCSTNNSLSPLDKNKSTNCTLIRVQVLPGEKYKISIIDYFLYF
jgi:hypothetical protein